VPAGGWVAAGVWPGFRASALLANIMRDPNVLAEAGRRLNHWIGTLEPARL